MRLRKAVQPKDEHPMQEEWDEIKQRAEEQGLLRIDGIFILPDSIGCVAQLPISEYTGQPYDPELVVRLPR
jgi:hypothetical protein